MRSPTAEQRQLILDSIGFKPTEGQAPIIFDDHQIIQVVGGWRSGKSCVGTAKLASQYWLGDLYWLLGADYEMCREEFGYLVEFFKKLGLVKHCQFPSRDQCVLEIAPNIVIETKSAKYPEKIAAKAPDGILICEAAQVAYEIFLRSLGRLVEKDGWLLMEGTLETSLDWYSDKSKEYQIEDNTDGGISYSLPTWSNTAIFKGGRDDPRIKRWEATLGPDLFSERFGGVSIKPKGLVLPEFKTTLHTGYYPLDPKEPIHLGIDPGWFPSVYSVLIIQFIGDDIRVCDEIYEQQLTTEQIITILQKKSYYQNVVGGAIDIGSQQHQGQKPVYDIWHKETGLRLDSKRIKPLSNGVSRLRTFLIPHPVTGDVQVHINSSCRGLISELGGCKSPIASGQDWSSGNRGAWKMKMDRTGNVLSEEPDEKNCDAIKALIYAVVSRYGLGVRPGRRSISYIDI